jgi:hypothetical protein
VNRFAKTGYQLLSNKINAVIIEIKIDNGMPSNPFFSGRIPPELLDAIEKHRQLTGESKTDLLIKALSQYVNFQLEEEEPKLPPIYKKLDEAFQRIKKLEKSVFSKDNIVITDEEKELEVDPNQIEIDFNTEEKITDNGVITNESRIMTTIEVVELLGVSRSTVNSWKNNERPKLYEGYEVEFDDIKSGARTNYWIVRELS